MKTYFRLDFWLGYLSWGVVDDFASIINKTTKTLEIISTMRGRGPV